RHLAAAIAGFVQGDIEHFRTVCGILGPVTTVENQARGDAIGARHLQAVATPVDGRFDLAGCVRAGLGRSRRHAPRIDDRLPVPGAVATIPLPALVEAQQLPLETLAVQRLPIAANKDHLEACELAVADLAAGK